MVPITENDLALFRERAKTELKSTGDIGRLAWDDVVEALCKEVARLRSGDCAKLREALEELVANIEMRSSTFGLNVMVDTKTYLDAKAALAALPRNCDVGTAQEQDERFHRFCVKHHTGSCAGCHNPVGDYTVANGVRECALVWAQMPYEEGDAK